MTLEVTFRPVDAWPGQLTAEGDRVSSPFSASYTRTLRQLERELDHLDARLVVVQLALTGADLRLDGMPRAGARPAHPGVVLAFESSVGPLKYATDRYRNPLHQDQADSWKQNLRAITLGLEALRRVDRYGITKRGEQYRGWAALGAGEPMPATHMTTEDAARLIVETAAPHRWAGVVLGNGDIERASRAIIADPDYLKQVYRDAAKASHPDRHGGDEALFVQVQAARDLLARGAS